MLVHIAANYGHGKLAFAEVPRLGQVVKVNASVTDLTRFAWFNEIYREFFSQDPPARTTVGADLLGILVEVDCVGIVRGDG